MNIFCTISFIVFFSINFSLMAQVSGTTCDAILKHGIYNIDQQFSKNTKVDYLLETHKGINFSSLDEQSVFALEVKVYGYGKGKGGANISKRRLDLKEWFDQQEKKSDVDEQTVKEIRRIETAALDAWIRCQEINADSEISMQTSISEDDNLVNISLRYTGHSNSGITLIDVSDNNFDCKCMGPEIVNQTDNNEIKSFPYTVDNRGIAIRCERTGKRTQVRENGYEYVLYPEADVSVHIAGRNFQLYFPDTYDLSLPDTDVERLYSAVSLVGESVQNSMPTGTIISFGGRKESIMEGWLLCDGRSIPIDSYPELFDMIGTAWGAGENKDEFRLPDLRGQFLRGVEQSTDGRSSGTDPGDRYTKYEGGATGIGVGTYQSENFKIHHHEYKEWRWQVGCHGGGSYLDILTANKNNKPLVKTESNPGGPETRPDNVAVNFFIRSGNDQTFSDNSFARQSIR